MWFEIADALADSRVASQQTQETGIVQRGFAGLRHIRWLVRALHQREGKNKVPGTTWGSGPLWSPRGMDISFREKPSGTLKHFGSPSSSQEPMETSARGPTRLTDVGTEQNKTAVVMNISFHLLISEIFHFHFCLYSITDIRSSVSSASKCVSFLLLLFLFLKMLQHQNFTLINELSSYLNKTGVCMYISPGLCRPTASLHH